jgi:membrane associated rhomboid family serine protease
VAILFGGALAWDLVPKSGVSWEDHLFGGIGGIVAARLLTPPRVGAKKRGGSSSPTPATVRGD